MHFLFPELYVKLMQYDVILAAEWRHHTPNLMFPTKPVSPTLKLSYVSRMTSSLPKLHHSTLAK